MVGDPLGHVGERRRLDEDPLHGDARLPRLVVPERRDALGGPVPPGVVRGHQHRAVAAQFERHVLARHLPQDLGPHRSRAGERHHREPRVVDQLRGPVVGHRQHRDHRGRQVGLGEQRAQVQRRQRRRGRRLDHDGAARGDGGADLVRHEVQREVERRDAQHGAAREAAHHRQAALGGLVGVEPLERPREPPGLLGGPAEGRDRALHLDPRPGDRLPGLGGDELGARLGLLVEAAADVFERLGADVRGQGRGLGRDARGGRDRRLDLARRGPGGGAHRRVVEGVCDEEFLFTVLRTACHPNRRNGTETLRHGSRLRVQAGLRPRSGP